LGAIQDLLYDLSVEISMGIAVIEKRIALIIHVTRVISRETKDIAALPLNPIKLKLQIDSATVMLNFHEVNNRLAISPGKSMGIAGEQRYLGIDKTLNSLWIRNGIELPLIDRHFSSFVAVPPRKIF